MIKHLAAIILLSIVVILTMAHVQQIVNALMSAHEWVATTLTQIFSNDPAGDLTRQLIALLCIPVVIALIPATVYYLAKRSWFPYFMTFVWVTWLVEVTALVILYKAAVV